MPALVLRLNQGKLVSHGASTFPTIIEVNPSVPVEANQFLRS
jgi:hypothetical protein